jgi:glycolate oxidase iron-sulfur subunit
MAATPRAWDEHKPPQREVIDDCVHCGFCLPTCPTYALWGEEMDSPRGRIVLMREGLEEGSELTDVMVTHLDRCLGCMACVTACPSGVRYDKLIEDARAQVERNHDRGPQQRALREAIFETFTHPGRLRAMVPALAAARRLGITRLARRRGGVVDRLGPLKDMLAMAPEVKVGAAAETLAKHTPARGTRRGSVGFLQGCVQRVFFADVNRATVDVLAAEGFGVYAPRAPRCCGALQLHSGYDEPAVELAKKTIEAFEGCETVLVNAAGCGSAMKEYGHLLREEPGWLERASEFSSRVQDVTEFLAGVEPAAERRPVPMKVAYHDPCHLAHAQGVRAEPRKLLRDIPELELCEPAEWELCCGSAGIYNLVNPDAAADLGRRKLENLLDTGAEAVAAANPGCALQIVAHARQAGRELPVHHPMELLRRSIEGNGNGRHS